MLLNVVHCLYQPILRNFVFCVFIINLFLLSKIQIKQKHIIPNDDDQVKNMMATVHGIDIDTEDNYFLSCERPSSPKKYSNIATTVRMSQIPPLSTPGLLSFHYFCGNN